MVDHCSVEVSTDRRFNGPVATACRIDIPNLIFVWLPNGRSPKILGFRMGKLWAVRESTYVARNFLWNAFFFFVWSPLDT